MLRNTMFRVLPGRGDFALAFEYTSVILTPFTAYT